jgi:hypothetical protein
MQERRVSQSPAKKHSRVVSTLHEAWTRGFMHHAKDVSGVWCVVSDCSEGGTQPGETAQPRLEFSKLLTGWTPFHRLAAANPSPWPEI